MENALIQNSIKAYQLPSDALLKLKSLLNLREKMVRQKAGYQASIKEMKRLFPEKNNPVWFKFQRRILKELKEQIKKMESEMKQVRQ